MLHWEFPKSKRLPELFNDPKNWKLETVEDVDIDKSIGDELGVVEVTPEDVGGGNMGNEFIEEEMHKLGTVRVRSSAPLRRIQSEYLKNAPMGQGTRRDVKNVDEITPVIEKSGHERIQKHGTARVSQNISGTGHEKDILRHDSLDQTSCLGTKH